MKLYCSRQKLNEAVSNVQRAVSSKSTMPSLEGVLLKTTENGLFVCGYDLEIGITTTIDATVSEEGKIVVNARLFSEIIKKLPEDKIFIEVNEKLNVYIRSGKVDFNIIGISAEEYPELPTVANKEIIKINGDVLSSMIRQTHFAIAETDVKPAHKGSRFEIENGRIRMISVDGYRLAIRTEDIDYQGEKHFVVPGKSLAEVNKLIGDSEEEMNFSVGGRHIIFRINDYSVITRLLDGEFMNYNSAIQKNHSTDMRVNTRKFINAIERMSLLLNDKLKIPVRCRIENGLIKCSCNTSVGQAYDEFEASINGQDVEIGFDNRFMLDALRYSETDEVKIEMNGPLSPIVLKPADGDSFLFLVLPVRLKNDI